MRGSPGDGDSDDEFAQWYPDYSDSTCPYCSSCSEYGHAADSCPWVWNEVRGWHKPDQRGSSWRWSLGYAAIVYLLLAAMFHTPQRAT